MTAVPETSRHIGWAETITVYLRPRVLIVMFLGLSSGLPLALSGSTLLVWMREAGVDLGTIGLFALVGTPYTIKFLWAPLVDALDVPVLSRAARAAARLARVLATPADGRDRVPGVHRSREGAMAGRLRRADGRDRIGHAGHRDRRVPRRDAAAERAGRRHGLLCRGLSHRHAGLDRRARCFSSPASRAWGLAKGAAWTAGYLAMAACVLIGIVATLLATEPEKSAAANADHAAHAAENPVRRVMRAANGAFSEFLTREMAIVVLLFVVLYKFCDAFAGTMTAPFVIDLGFSRNDYAAIVKGVGLAATLIGGFAGGMVARALPMTTCLWIGGLLQAASNLVFAWLAYMGTNYWALTAAIIAENFTGAIGTVIFVAYLRRCARARCTPRRNSRCSPRCRPSAAPICRRAPATSRSRPAGRHSSC